MVMMMLIIFYLSKLEAACPTSHPIVHDSVGIVMAQCSPSASCLHSPKFWCLSGGSANNNGTNTSWWVSMWSPSGYFNGNWSSFGVVGCCGMWDATSFDSKTMTAIVEIASNKGLATHAGYVDVEVAEARSNGFLFTRPYHLYTQKIPSPYIENFISTGPGGVSTFDITGFLDGQSINYWVILENEMSGNNLLLNPRCSPGGVSPCPPPIEGYKVVAITSGCADGTCNDPTPSPPTTSVASQWNLSVSNRYIQGRVPTFPIYNVQVTNPSNENPSNAYIYVALVMMYGYDSAWGGRIEGVYTSANSIGFRWGLPGSEITSLEANYVMPGIIKIKWKSVVEGNVSSYNVYRSYKANGTYERINSRTIPAVGIDGSLYSYKDRVILSIPRDIYYKIEVVHYDGTAVLQPNVAKVKARPN